MKLVLALMIAVGLTACGKSDPTAFKQSLITEQYAKMTFLLDQCPKTANGQANCGVDELAIIEQACTHARVAVSFAVDMKDQKIYNDTKRIEKRICG